MHGVKRSRIPPVADTAEVARKKHEKEQQKIQEYTALTDELVAKSKTEDYSQATLDLSTKVLQLNPEYQTGWSIRRRVLLRGPLAQAQVTHTTLVVQASLPSILEADLNLTNSALRQNPKNYSTWEHRKWVLETMPDANWAFEMKMVEAYLEKDGRNFHSWDYRRYIVASLSELHAKEDAKASESGASPEASTSRSTPNPKRPRPTTTSELAYSKRKIAENFSNFSAWHYRSKLLPKLWEEQGWEEGSEPRAKQVDEEFHLVKQAIWSDPNDQSAWLYHRWLVGRGALAIVRREIDGIKELLEEEPDSRWCLDSLIYYQRLLHSLLGDGDVVERDELNASNLAMLNILKIVDPMRKGRYQDLG
ncbi:BZ3500_MvSof-1268-A1-R1_Chr1-1g01051 [Microbotryum saponariae]|uniref:Geranylgeranyl transferase type-2 subunit alpha n=1 Tax=Microbotryum saponariae TaxID=289078 RepID=A0A2X0M4V4_9BASI|nr:BZ3500_MvSof-1268-A1-R1_Chr1-1g01051 [Microbotryum saponariae]SCZ93299.1 BZ3501_MvSof-1269-A2-R1_Chr1-1g00648 [Microbotryum saponariae]